ncbi:MAG: monofunctional biosynthetic peptidoglycan transglycosylase [Bacteroidaceae bacterium]|mgnify:FL=1|nr:monofunctional biosynthetic peptidoglycan transglycosylase [Bacteroidaceae bacterium]
MNLLRAIRKILRWSIGLFFASSLLAVIVYKWVPVPVTPLMLIRCCQQMSKGEKIRLKFHWVKLDEEITPELALAVVASEDQKFLSHNGFDLDAISLAWEERVEGKRKRGASTISQQTAKNVFLWPGGGWFRKGLEAYFTILIELIWDKHRIMEVYLNVIEMGDGIYGADALAWQHFGRSADRLTRANCALIAATLPNPLKYSSKNPSKYMLRRQTQIMQQMKNLGSIKWE